MNTHHQLVILWREHTLEWPGLQPPLAPPLTPSPPPYPSPSPPPSACYWSESVHLNEAAEIVWQSLVILWRERTLEWLGLWPPPTPPPLPPSLPTPVRAPTLNRAPLNAPAPRATRKALTRECRGGRLRAPACFGQQGP
eukprot:9488973-Pyramimonas_sp.AAC.3